MASNKIARAQYYNGHSLGKPGIYWINAHFPPESAQTLPAITFTKLFPAITPADLSLQRKHPSQVAAYIRLERAMPTATEDGHAKDDQADQPAHDCGAVSACGG